MLINMDNPNLNPSAPMPSSSPENKFPSYNSMKKGSQKTPHFIVAVIAILAVGVGVIVYFLRSDFDYAPLQVGRQENNPPSEVDEVDSVNLGNLDAEFRGIDSDLNSL